MELWVIWILAAVVFAVGEIATTSFFVAPFSGGALVAALVALLGGGVLLSGVAFLAASVALLTFVRPIAKRHLYTPPSIRTGTAALVGTSAVVVERVTDGAGAAKIAGEVWTARPFDEDRTIEPGEKVQVMEIRGATALLD